MRKFLLALLLTSISVVGMAKNASYDPATAPKLAFTENKGQIVDLDGKVRPDVLFTAENNGVKMYFRNDALSYVFTQTAKEGDAVVVKSLYRADVEFLGANPNPRILTEKSTGTNTHFYLGHNPKGVTNVKSYEKIVYQNIYPSIDLAFFTTENGTALKYEFIVKPGGNPSDIRLNYKGFSNLSTNRQGAIESKTPYGNLNEEKPFTFQLNDGAKKEVTSNYKISNGVVTFGVGGYDTSKDLVIDPLTRQWSFNRGGSLLDRVHSNSFDAAGNLLVAGYSASTAFPTNVGVAQTNFAGINDAIVMSISPSGSINWSTYYGGAGRDQAFGVSVGANNVVNVVGVTTSVEAGLATAGSFQPTANAAGDGFVLQLNSSGARNWASYYGGASNDQLNDVATFSNGDLAVIGRTFSNDNIATSGSIAGNRDIYVARISANGSSRTWARYFGGNLDDQGNSVAIDNQGNVIIAGQSTSTGLASNGSDQATFGGSTDAILGKFGGTDGSVLWSTYLGGAQLDIANGVTTDLNGNIFVTGLTSSVNLPQRNAVQPSFGGVSDAFVAAYSTAGTRLMSSFIGGNATEQGYGISVIGNYVYLTGASNSSNFAQVLPSPSVVNFTPQVSNNGAFDIFVSKINTSNFSLTWSVLYGGKADDIARDLTTNSSGRVAFVGYTNSADFPTRNPINGQLSAGTGNDDVISVSWQDDTAPCSPLGVVLKGSDALCNGTPTGTVEATAPIGANFQYSITAGPSTRTEQSSPIFNNLAAGSYTVSVRNTTDNCTSTSTILVNQPASKVATTTQINPNCGLGGSITVNVANSTSNDLFLYSVTGPGYDVAQTTPDNIFRDIPSSGTYTVKITDVNGCDFMAPDVTIVNGTLFSNPIATSVSATCANINDGSILVSSPSGNGVTYALIGQENRPAQVSARFTDLAPGTYFVTAFSGTCSSTSPQAITVGFGTSLNLSATTSVNATCLTSSDGSIFVNGPTGMTNAMYSLSGAMTVPAQVSNVFTGLRSGAYTVTVMNGENCSGTLALTVGANNTNLLEFSSTPASCSGQNNGSIRVLKPLGAGTLYSLIGNNVNVVNQATTTFSNLAAGAYTLTATTDNSCVYTKTVNVSTPTGLIFTTVKPSASSSCTTQNGSIELATQGGSGTVLFELGGPVSKPKQVGNVFNFLPPGTYTVVATDANNCQTTAQAVIAGPTGLTLTVAPQATICGNGSITVTPSVAGTYTYKLTGVVNRETVAPSPFTFNLLPAGSYTVIVTDANGCTASSPATVASGPTSLVLSIAEEAIKCKGGKAKIVVGVTGATNAVTVTLKDNATNAIFNSPFNSIPPGNYTISATEANTNCSANQLYTVVEPAQLTATSVATQISCVNNQQSGIVTVTANGGTGVKMFMLSGRTEMQTSNVITDVEPGNYTVKVTDANGCEVTTNTVTINTVNRVKISSVNTVIPKCNGGKDGMIIVNTVDGVAPFSYRINGGAFSASSTSRSFMFANQKAGDFTVDVRDANGCIATQAGSLQEPTAITAVTTGVTPTSCVVGDGSLTINTTGGTAPYMFSIDKGATYQTSNKFDFVFANYYEILIKDANGCVDTTTYTLNNAGAPTILNISKQDAQCFNEQSGTGQIIIAAASPTPQPLFYSINDGVSFTATSTGAAVFTGLAAGNYLIRVSTESGCTAFGGPISIDAPAPYLIQSVITTNPFCSNNSPVGGKIEVRVNGGKAPLSYSIDGGLTYQESNLFTNLYPRQEGYTVTVRDANGCIALGTQTKFLTNSSGLTLPLGQPTVVQPSCGMMNGSITIAPSGGSGQKKYYLDGVLKATLSGSSYTYSGLGEGNYIIKVTDANGCSIDAKVTLGTVNFTTTVTKATCTPLSQPNGTINVKVTGGSGSYKYSIVTGRIIEFAPGYNTRIFPRYDTITPPGVEEFTFTGLNVGVYEIEVSDMGAPPGQGCTKRMKVVVEGNSGTPVITNVNKIDRVCNGGSTTGPNNAGSISVFSNGASDFILIGPGNIILQQPSSSNTFGETTANNLPAGEYFVFAANGDGCFTAWSSNPVVITEPKPIVISNVATTQPTCGGIPTGTITISATGGTAQSNLEYSIDGGVLFQSSPIFSNIAAGSTFSANSSIIVREKGTAASCMILWPLNIAVNNEANFAVLNSTTTTPQSCNGPADGTATVNVTNGTPPYTYTLSPTSGAPIVLSNVGSTTQTFTGLLNGSYFLTVKDAKGCVATNPQPIIIQQTISDVSVVAVVDVTLPGTPYACGVNIYDLQFTYTGPEMALDVSFDGGNSFPIANRTGLTNGIGNLIDILVPGAYTIVIQPVGSNCKIIKNIVITEPGTPFEISSIQITNPSCNGANDGLVRITGRFNDPAGGTLQLGTLPVRTRATAGNFNFVYQNLSANTHNLVINDGSLSCSYTLPITISQPPAISIQGVTITPMSCNGNVANPSPDGQIIISAAGATNMDYSIDNGINYRPTNTFTGLTVGDYVVAVRNRDFPLCAAVTQTVRVTSSSNFNLFTIGINNGAFQASCSSVNDASIKVVINNPVNNMTFFLNGVQKSPVTSLNNGQLFVDFLNVPAGTYSVKALDPFGCYDLLDVVLPATKPLAVTSSTAIAPTCGNVADGAINFTISGGQDAFPTDINQPFGREYSIRNVRTNAVIASNVLISTAGNYSFTEPNLLAGVYEITVKNKNTLCDQVISTVFLNSKNTPAISLLSSSQPTQPLCANGQITIRTVPAAPGARYAYFTTTTAGFSPAGGQTSRTFSGLAPGTYYFRQVTGANCFSFTGPITLTCTSPRETIVEFNEEGNVSVYPNPTRGEFSVSFNTNEVVNASVEMYDLTGRKVLTQNLTTKEGLNETTFNAHSLSSGVYMLRISIGDRVTTTKVVKD